jgi:hypothetical protein
LLRRGRGREGRVRVREGGDRGMEGGKEPEGTVWEKKMYNLGGPMKIIGSS